MCKPEVKTCLLKLLGANMMIVSPVAIALGIVDLILTQQIWCGQNGLCVQLSNPVALTMVSVAIWAPVPIFVNGAAVIWFAKRPTANKGWICLLSFFNTVAFGPVIVIITIMEIMAKFPGGQSAIPLLAPPGANSVYGVEVVIVIIGVVLTLHAMAVLHSTCCCADFLREEILYMSSKEPVNDQVYIDARHVAGNAKYPATMCAPEPIFAHGYSTPAIRTNYAPGAVHVSGLSNCPAPRTVLTLNRW